MYINTIPFAYISLIREISSLGMKQCMVIFYSLKKVFQKDTFECLVKTDHIFSINCLFLWGNMEFLLKCKHSWRK